MEDITLTKMYGIQLLVMNYWLVSEKKLTNMIGAAFLMFDDCISKKIVGHVPFSWSKLAAKFLQFPNHRIRVIMTWKWVNRVDGFGMKIPVDCIFYRDSRVATWLEKALEKWDNSLKVKVETYIK